MLFTKTKKETPKDEVSKNAELLIRAGFIYKEMAGVYTLLPLGLRVIKNIEKIIREEMNVIGGLEMKTSILQSREIWEKSGRWEDSMVDNWFKTSLKNGTEVGLSWTNEESYTNILKQYINSYKELPVYVYDFKDILRNETRSKSGIMRGREFYWKALYSFSKNKEEHDIFYEKIKNSYKKIFIKMGLGDFTYITFASGGSFAEFSHEFQAVTSAGEDTIFVDEKKGIAVNKEVYTDKVLNKLELDKEKLVEQKAIEVGNIFSLGSKFSEPFDLSFQNEEGESHSVFMGSYGIGLGRLMGTIAETLSDDKGIIWPESVAPYQVHLLMLGDDEVVKEAEQAYIALERAGVEVLFDDRVGVSAGAKFADADLIGIPYRLVISGRSLDSGGIEVKRRDEKEVEIMKLEDLMKKLKPSI